MMNGMSSKSEWKNHILQGTIPIFSGRAEMNE